MDTFQFFDRVTARRGNIVICALKVGLTRKDDRFWNAGNCPDVSSAVSKVLLLDGKPELTAYFSVGTHENNETVLTAGSVKILRKKITAAYFKALALDLDCGVGKPYATQKDGVRALLAALATFSFPDPMLVNSGNGVHCYWPFVEEIPAAEWERLSIALRHALREGGVQIDESKIHDTSMVLRPVGSHHKKSTPWKRVSVVSDCPDYPVATLEALLANWLGKAVAAPTPSKRPMSPTAAAILSGGYDPLNVTMLAKGCRQIASMLASGGATDAAGAPVGEPMWRGALGIAKYADDPTAAVVALCSGHPTFDLHQNLVKMANWGGSGVTTCAYFEQHCASGCAGCPSKGQIKSPAALNIRTQLDVSVAIDPAAPEVVVPASLPPSYFAANGKVWTEIEVERSVEDAQGKKTKQWVTERVKVSDYPLVVLDRYSDTLRRDKTTVLWAAKFPLEGWKSFEMPSDALMSGGQELMKYFGNKQLYIESEALLNRTRKYMVTFLGYQQQQRESGMDMESYGWQQNGTFLCGEKLVSRDGALSSWRASKALISLSARIRSRGDRAVWVDFTKLLDQPDAHIAAFSMLVAGSGLLLQGSGIPSFVYSLYSGETGTGKTFALLLGNTLFGHPTDLLLQPSDTENALYQIMGSMGSLSAAMDEVTTMGEERAAAFAFQAQTGREKMRLNSSAELREGVRWHAPLRVSTNKSLFNMYDNVRVKNEAEKVRTLELQVDDKTFVNGHDMQSLIRVLTDNHGFAAPELASEIVKRGGVRKVYDDYVGEFNKQFTGFSFEGDERFYAGGVIASYGVGCVGRDLGLFSFNIEGCVRPILDRIVYLRSARLAYRQDCFDSIGQFLAEYNDRIVVFKEDKNSPASRAVVQAPIPDVAFARMELVHDPKNPVLPGSRLMINSVKLREWAKNSREDYGAIVNNLQKQGVLIDDKARVSLYKGTHHSNPGQAFCLVLDLVHPRFAAVITSTRSIAATNPALAILQGGRP